MKAPISSVEATCTKCEETKELGEFYKTPRKLNGVLSACKQCCRLYINCNKYDITVDQYLRMSEEQGGVCKICEQPEPTHYNLAIDHCHTTGKIRGLLCFSCNVTLGKYEKYKSEFEVYLND